MAQNWIVEVKGREWRGLAGTQEEAGKRLQGSPTRMALEFATFWQGIIAGELAVRSGKITGQS